MLAKVILTINSFFMGMNTYIIIIGKAITPWTEIAATLGLIATAMLVLMPEAK